MTTIIEANGIRESTPHEDAILVARGEAMKQADRWWQQQSIRSRIREAGLVLLTNADPETRLKIAGNCDHHMRAAAIGQLGNAARECLHALLSREHLPTTRLVGHMSGQVRVAVYPSAMSDASIAAFEAAFDRLCETLPLGDGRKVLIDADGNLAGKE